MAAIENQSIEDQYSLSPLQQGMLFHTLREKGVGMYISQAVSRYENLDCDALKKAWQTMVERHTILRTSFHWDDPENPVQKVHRHVFIPFLIEDWRGISPSEQNSRLRKFQREERENGFDLNQPTQIRVAAIQVTRSRWLCINTHHHIILDGWSGSLLANEVGRAYDAYRRGTAPELKPPIPFGTYIRWIASQNIDEAKMFWQKQLESIDLPTPLPAERALGGNTRTRMHIESWEVKLDNEAATRIGLFARKCKVTLYTIIQSVWPILLSRYSGQQTVLFGSLVSGRPPELKDVESIVGMFLNTIPFCVKVEDDMTVSQWLQKIYRQRTEMQRFEHTPLMLIQQLSRIPGGMPLFTTLVARKDVTQAAADGRGRRNVRKTRSGKLDQANFQQNYPILLNITARNGIELKITYDARRFRAIDISRILEQMRQLLLTMCEDGERRMGDIQMASADELNRINSEWNDTFLKIDHTPALDQLVAQNAQTQPNQTAVRYKNLSLSFKGIEALTNKTAAQLQILNLGSGDLIAVCQQSKLSQLIAVLATLRIRARCLPIDWDKLEENHPTTLLQKCHAIISDHPAADICRFPHIHIDLESIIDGEFSEKNVVSSRNENNSPQIDNQFVFKSDFGNPVVFSNWFMATRFAGQTVAFTPKTETLFWTPADSVLFFSEIYGCWQSYGTASLIDNPVYNGMTEFSSELKGRSLHRITVTPTLLSKILNNPDCIDCLAHISVWFSWGEPLTPELGERFYEKFQQSRLINLFAGRRTGPCLAWEVPRTGILSEGIRIGYPLPNIRAHLTSDGTHASPIGVMGELLLAVDGIHPAVTRKKNPENSDDPKQSSEIGKEPQSQIPDRLTVIHTNKIVRRWNDGSIEHIGTVQADSNPEQVITADKVQREIAKMDQVVNACITVSNQTNVRTAFIETPQQTLDFPGLHKRLCRMVSDNHAPTHYYLMPQLPVDSYGRIDTEKLHAMNGQGVNAADFKEVIKTPVSDLEKIIADVWMDVLKIDRISTDDNFFELGGHSLAATKVIARLTRILKSDIHLKGIFEAPTVSSLAEWIQSDKHLEERPFAIELSDRGKDAPLTFTQQQLWIMGQLFPHLSMYTIPSSAGFMGKMDLDAMRKALRDVVERHEILRTVFVSNEGEPRQIVQPVPEEIPMEFFDLTHLPEQDRPEKARWHGAQAGRRSWDLEKGPLFRVQLIKLADDQYLMNTAFHHIIADGPSKKVFYDNLNSFYRAHQQGKVAKLPKLTLEFADYAVWERDKVKGELFQKQLDYWRHTLDGATLLEIPMDFSRPAVHGFFGKKIKFEINARAGSRLHRIGQKEGATIFMCLLAVYQLLLHKYSGLDDIVVGSAMSNRIRMELERMIGLFVNTLPLRTDFSGKPTFRELLKRVRKTCLGAFTNMDLPFEETIAQIQPQRDLSRLGSPLFQFMLIHIPAGRDPNKAAGRKKTPPLKQSDSHIDTGYANFDLLLSTRDSTDGSIQTTLVYDTELFRQQTIERMIIHFKHLFESVSEFPDIPVSDLDMSGDEERQEVLIKWNGKDIEPETRPIHELIFENAAQFPDHPAVYFHSRHLTYRELDRLSTQLAKKMTQAGVTAETMVAICLPKSDTLIVGILAILKAGGAFVPVDIHYPADRIKHILTETRCQILVSNPEFGPAIQMHKPDLKLIDASEIPRNNQDDIKLSVKISPTNLAYVIFTSGSTGLPKGVMVEHHNLVNIIKSQVRTFQITRESRVLQMLSISFDAAVGEIFRALVAGATLFMAEQDDLLPGPDLILLLKKHRITAMAISPTALGAMPESENELPDLQTITVGGEACSQKIAKRWGKGRRLLNGYGPTETTIGATLAVNWDFSGKPPLGHPLPGVKTYVLDTHGRLAPVGTPGELFIGGIGVTRGYLNRPDLTAECFLPNPFSDRPTERIYKTGDLVRWLSTGQLDFLGRIDQQVKIRGFRIELGEIETALSEHPAIDHCIVSVHESDSVKRLIAYMVSKTNSAIDTAELRTFLKQKLPDYMIPAFFMPLNKIPTTANGKVDRRALPEPALADLVTSTQEYVAPATEIEKKLTALWSEVLGLEKIGVLDNFFEIGGDSISAIRVTARAGSVGIQFTARDIFVNQTIRDLSESLQERSPSINNSVVENVVVN